MKGYAVTAMAVVKTKKLGQILLEAGAVTPEKLDLALKEQSQTGEKLGRTLQRLGICSEKDIAKVLAGQAGVECIELSQVKFSRELMSLIKRDYAEDHSLIPVERLGSTLKIAMANPLDLATIDEVGRITGVYVEVVHAPESEIQEALVRYYGLEEDQGLEFSRLIESAQMAQASGVNLDEGDSPYIKLVDEVIKLAVKEGATDIHIEPEEMVLRCRYRVDGQLIQGPILPLDLLGIVITRFKIMAEMNISESRVPQDGRIFFDSGKRPVDLRVSTFPTMHGEAICCRILDKQSLIVGLDKLGMSDEISEPFGQDITRPHGIILVTGPTGSGKTTTLYSALTFLNRPDTKIITLEDPVEYELPVINQAQINTAKGFTFAKGLRAILRQDPDILLVGEIRDVETAELAIRAALTGHLVFSTLHTNSAVGAIPRLLDMGIEPFLLSATLVAVLAQRLVRTVCSECAQPVTLAPEQLARLGMGEHDQAAADFRQGTGCDMCRQTGFRGRMAIFEYLQVGPAISRMIVEGASVAAIDMMARQDGMSSLADDARVKLMTGKTTFREVMRVVA